MKHVLFVCGRARQRSPTAEQLFAALPGIETASAGLNPDADTALDADLVEWADIIFVMEPAQRRKLTSRFSRLLARKRIICLNIPDRYAFMAPELVRLLEQRGSPHLR